MKPTDLISLELMRYPRTPHLQGSRLQEGDDGSDQIALSSVAGTQTRLEEKLDGANAGISFSGAGELLLQSRGHYLVGGGRERQFGPLKHWAQSHADVLLERLEDRYVMYGEWMYSKHSLFYDRLPHLFLEFDIYDRKEGVFLSTPRRKALLKDAPVLSVPVLYDGPMPGTLKELTRFVRPSLAKSPQWADNLARAARSEGLSVDLVRKQTDMTDKAEGLYVKFEDDHQVLARAKWVRRDFVQAILDSGSHHSARPLLPNWIDERVALYAPKLALTWEDLGLVTEYGDDLKSQSGNKPAWGKKR